MAAQSHIAVNARVRSLNPGQFDCHANGPITILTVLHLP